MTPDGKPNKTVLVIGGIISLAAAAGVVSVISRRPPDNVPSEIVAETETAAPAEGETPSETAEAVQTKGLFEEFETVDLDGNTVTQEIFAEHDLTLINIWGTFCGPCVREMPDLGKLHNEYASQDFQVVGVCIDAGDQDLNPSDEQIEEAQSIVKKADAYYTHLLAVGEFGTMLVPQVQVVPISLFVDSEGRQVGEIIPGAMSHKAWKEKVDETLAMVKD